MTWQLEEAIAYYRKQGAPGDQSALIALLGEIQRENGGGIPVAAVEEAAKAYGVKESLLLALIKRVPRLHLADTHCLEICCGPNCGRRTELAEAAQRLCGPKGTVKQMPCMRLCGKGPNIKWDGKLYHQADETLLRRLLKD